MGPAGMGPGTGWGLGPCGGGMSRGRGMGCGFGWRRFPSKEEETDMLTEDIKEMEEELKGAKERLAELKK
jgi:hypothetical protein